MAKLAIARLSCYLQFTSPPFGQLLCPFSQLHSIAHSSLIHFSRLQSTCCLLLCARRPSHLGCIPFGLLRFSCIVQPHKRLPNCIRNIEISSKSLINWFESLALRLRGQIITIMICPLFLFTCIA